MTPIRTTGYSAVLLGTASLLALSIASGCEPNQEVAPPAPSPVAPPNVVFILADDLGFGELGSYGQERIRTPNLDRLANEGMRFTRNYSGAPVCAPARNSLLTGKHLGHTTIRGNLPAQDAEGNEVEGQHPIPAEARTLGELFREHGYTTGAMGKWGLGPIGSSGDPNDQGFDRFFGYICQRVAHSYYPPHLWADDEKLTINQNPIPGHERQLDGTVTMSDWFAEQYAPDLILDDALQFLEQNQDSPFFLYLPFVEPHLAMQPPSEWVEQYPEEWDERPYRGKAGYLPHPRPRAGYAAMISDLDEHVGTVLAKLDELGLRENTLVIFTSDNGTTHRSSGDEHFGVGGVDSDFFNSTAGLRGFKGSVYEGGIRVPLIARWPGKIDAGALSEQITYFPDWFPTLSEVIGGEPEPGLDGVSILPALFGQSQVARNPMVWVFPEYGGQLAVRFGKYKLVHQQLDEPLGSRPDWELYDLDADPGEENDLAAQHPELVAEGIEILRRENSPNELFPVPIPEA